MELQIDTSTRYASVGLSVEGESRVEIAWRSERNHSVELAPAINRALDHAKSRITDLDAIVVTSGPGAFSALRVGMSTAKAIASTRGMPLVTVGTLEVRGRAVQGARFARMRDHQRWPESPVRGADHREVRMNSQLDVSSVDEFLKQYGARSCCTAVKQCQMSSDQISDNVGTEALVSPKLRPSHTSSFHHSRIMGFRKLQKG